MHTEKTITLLVLANVAMASILVPFIVTLVFQSQRRHFRLKARMEELKAEHALEIEAVQKEIYRQSLDDMATEIHDDIGQRLSVVKMMVSVLTWGPPSPNELETRIADIKRVVTDTVEGLRALTQQLRSDYENDISLPEAFQQELSRLNRLGIIATNLNVEGIPKKLDNKTSLFLFRMFQESLNNILAHSRALHCSVQLDYTADRLSVRIEDDGIGFTYPAPTGPLAPVSPAATASPPVPRQGIGLANIRKRSELIGAKVAIRTAPGLGTGIAIEIPYMKQIPIT